jgi:hypothetical protein
MDTQAKASHVRTEFTCRVGVHVSGLHIQVIDDGINSKSGKTVGST